MKNEAGLRSCGFTADISDWYEWKQSAIDAAITEYWHGAGTAAAARVAFFDARSIS